MHFCPKFAEGNLRSITIHQTKYLLTIFLVFFYSIRNLTITIAIF